jgi:hypothetical protein
VHQPHFSGWFPFQFTFREFFAISYDFAKGKKQTLVKKRGVPNLSATFAM